MLSNTAHVCKHASACRHTQRAHTQVWLLLAKSTYGPIIWSLKVFGFIFNSARELVCQLLDCLNHIIPPLCILMNVHQAKRCMHVCVCVCVCVAVVEKVCEHLHVRECVRACLVSAVHVFPCLCEYFGHTSLRSLARLESSLCLAAGHKNNL